MKQPFWLTLKNSAFMRSKILLVEDHTIVRQGLRAMLEKEFGLDVIGEASSGIETLDKVKTLLPDIVLIALNSPLEEGVESARQIRTLHPEIKILILSMHDDEAYLIRMFDVGANGYILNNTTKDELIYAINKIAKDGIYIDPEITLKILAKYKQTYDKVELTQKVSVSLSDREKDVLKLIAEGLTNIEMSRKLFTSVRTIETRRKSLLTKTGTTNTATLIKFAVENGLVE
jgi:DNA-binding NarL/FixJ family response regulator